MKIIFRKDCFFFFSGKFPPLLVVFISCIKIFYIFTKMYLHSFSTFILCLYMLLLYVSYWASIHVCDYPLWEVLCLHCFRYLSFSLLMICEVPIQCALNLIVLFSVSPNIFHIFHLYTLWTIPWTISSVQYSSLLILSSGVFKLLFHTSINSVLYLVYLFFVPKSFILICLVVFYSYIFYSYFINFYMSLSIFKCFILPNKQYLISMQIQFHLVLEGYS